MSTNREVIERFVTALMDAGGRGSDAVDALRHPDFIEDWPQSNERIVGIANMRAIDDHRPNPPAAGSVEKLVGSEDQFAISPMMTVVQIAGAGDMFTVVFQATYQQGDSWYLVMLCTVRDQRIWRATSYFAPLLDAPDWRAAWTVPITSASSTGSTPQSS